MCGAILAEEKERFRRVAAVRAIKGEKTKKLLE